ncbi:hypothetical protein [Kribbella ginsengisoli]|uniref:GDSL-like lipase/acylhydrolase family protein n=1 Tax=Kribbella ginsengisoli TaxID=363865 RepID=A0ABP6X3Y7_9ACTN
MTITLRPGSTVMFTGDSITDSFRFQSEEALGYGYPLRVAGERGYRHPDRPITWHYVRPLAILQVVAKGTLCSV